MTRAPRRFLLALLMLLLAGYAAGQEKRKEPEAGGDEIVQYLRAGNIVHGSIVRDAAGAEIRRETYIRDSDGNIAEIWTKWPDGSTTRMGTSGLVQWLDYSQDSRLFRVYYPDGTLKMEELREGGAVLERANYQYQGDPPRMASVLVERPGEKTREQKEYDSRGLLVRGIFFKADGSSEILLYSYDEEKRVSEIRNLSGRTETRTRFAYGADGEETEERFDPTGAVLLRTIKRTDGIVVEEHFDAGNLFARIYLKEGRKIREEMLSGGQLVRIWEYL